MSGDRPIQSRVSRRIRRRALSPVLLLGCAWTTGCVFFDNSYDACFGLSDCPSDDGMSAAGGKAGSTGELGEGGSHDTGGKMHAGSGGQPSAGGGGEVSSSGGGSDTGGGGSESASGGAQDVSSGGVSSDSGGASSGGAGGSSAGGAPSSGGDSGSGGDPSTGGVAGSGSETGAGGTGVPPARIVVNELRGGSGGFVELYNPSDQAFDLSTISITVEASGEPKWTAVCSLADVGTLEGKAFLEIRSGTSCSEESVCVKQCSEAFELGEKIYILDSNLDGDGVLIDFLYPSNISPAIGQSYAAKWDGAGEGDFWVTADSPGVSNDL